ncbi:MAG: DUF485 domain-containing protein [Bacteroidetes bacterium]|jgi:uncharacterized membrane protein (DUF485 family)|nr:DUF485 domain-containing protein [Bacteroidota bacterium]MBU1578771.1 DUF485 domain-containing protein [Bacteroidota bacterium]MBU2558562.1 DUF485 domain-containing protein [Bacteroidota bacterium]MDA3942842.1 DUF485 domain-containing protein [Bacteroidota bacterium]
MLHEPSAEIGTDKAAPKKAKLGVIMFVIYTIVYAGFVVIGLTVPEIMGLPLIGEQNIAIVYGFGLIVLAIIMGFIYNYFCTKYEDKLNNN